MASVCVPHGAVRVVHLTSAHPRDDVRIFHKQCKSLVSAGYDVTLIVADGLRNEVVDGVKILDVGFTPGRLRRILNTTKKVFLLASSLNAGLYHIHDPELIPAGLRLRRLRKNVVFDAHEDLPKQLLAKPYLTPFILRALSSGFALFERYALARFNGIVAATPTIRNKFLPINQRTVDICNYPILGELNENTSWSRRSAEICYVGNIAGIRGIREMVKAFELLEQPATLSLVGEFAEKAVEDEVRGYKGWQRVKAIGKQNRIGVRKALNRSVAGLVTLHPVVNYLDALPIKMFEYMAAGIPVIASDFPLWREIVDGNNCGLCIDPMKPKEIAAAVDYFLTNRQRAMEMGANGALAVRKYFNWSVEEKKLINFYDDILGAA